MRCAVDDAECVGGRLKTGLCEKHYRRQRASGTTASRRLTPLAMYVRGSSGCWMWTGALWRNGYGKPSTAVHGTRLAHRAFYIEHRGAIPDGFDLDHTCHNADINCPGGWGCEHRRCVNPEHLEPVAHRVNLMRGIEGRQVCEAGLHDLTLPGATKDGTKQCVACWRIRYREAGRRYRARQRAAQSAQIRTR